MPDFLNLWDDIHANWPSWYNEGRVEEAGIRGRFGKLTGVIPATEQLYFRNVVSDYRMPEAYKYPILSALRAAIKVQGRGARWLTDPFALVAEKGSQLTTIVGNAIRATNNPNKVGKDIGTWSSCYLVLESWLKNSLTEEAEKKEPLHRLRGKARETRTRFRCRKCGAIWIVTRESGAGGRGTFWDPT